MQRVSPHPVGDEVTGGQRWQSLDFPHIQPYILLITIGLLVLWLEGSSREYLPRTGCVCMEDQQISSMSIIYSHNTHGMQQYKGM